MTMNRFALVAAACFLIASPAAAAPDIDLIDNMDGSVMLRVLPSGTGSIATELAVTIGGTGITITDVVVADVVVFDTANPGNNPFTSSETTGLYHNGNDVFASYGSMILSSATPVNFLQISYTGSGTIDAFGLVAEGALNFTGLTASIDVITVPEPATVLLAGLALLGVASRRRN